MKSQTRSRLTLLLIAGCFLVPFIAAAVLFFSGWQPAGRRNYGELLQPPVDLSVLKLRRADGKAFEWQPDQNRWRFLVVAPGNCEGEACLRTIDTLHRLWLGQGRKADRIEVLWAGALPNYPGFRALVPIESDPDLLAKLPQASTGTEIPVYLVDPGGYLVLHYRPGFDPAGVRKDLGKLVK